jgi:hypothetical protein
MPMYKVTGTIQVYVEAKDECQAKDIATDNIDLANTKLEVGIVTGTLETEEV